VTRRGAIASLAALAISAGVCQAQDCLEPVGRWPYGVANAVAAEGNLAVLANGAALQVLDISVPSEPMVTGDVFFPAEVQSAALTGSLALVVAKGDLYVLDVSEPTPVQRGMLAGLAAGEVAADANVAYVQSYRRLSIVDVSDPAAPMVRGELVWSDGNPQGISITAGVALFADSDVGLRVVDVSDPMSPAEIAVLDLGPDLQATALDVANGFAYVVGYETVGFSDRLFVVDLAQPSQPAIVAGPIVAGSGDIVVHQGVAVIADDWSLHSYDVTDPLAPTWLGQVAIPTTLSSSQKQRLAAVDGLALLASHLEGLTIFDLTAPSAPEVAGTVETPGQVVDAAYAGGVLFIAASDRGFRTVDVADPTQPSVLVQTAVPGVVQVLGVDVQGDTAWTASASAAGLVALDVTDPSAPSVLGNAPGVLGGWITVSGDRATIVNTPFGTVTIADVSSPGTPVALGTLAVGSSMLEWPVIVGDYVVVRDNDASPSVVVVDASVPTAPVQVASFGVWTGFGGLGARGSWLLVPDIEGGTTPLIRIFDMSEPATPVEVEPYVTVGGVVDVVGVAGSVAYLAVPDSPPFQVAGIEAVDLADPLAPAFLGFVEGPGHVNRFAFRPDEVYAFHLETGFDIYALCQGPIFADDFESGTTSAWSSAVP